MSRDWSKYLVKGLPLPQSGEIPLRQDVRDLSTQQMYLYLEGLKKFQNTPKDDPLSYYQISGIHGLPYETWPNEPWNKDIPAKSLTKNDDSFGGFCTHTSILFLTWHRPYLSLFEATLQSHVKEFAEGIDPNHPEKKVYMDLAERFRIPYWDWARRDTQIVPEQALTVNDAVAGPPSSKAWQGDNYNPLFAYPFPKDTLGAISLDSPTTIRYPGKIGSELKNDILKAMEEFYKDPSTFKSIPKLMPERNLSERTAYLLQAYTTYPAMSLNKLREDKDGEILPDKENWGSMEDIHNAVHNLIGGGGHMSQISVSAFDPIFWLHHANIDRLFSIWQALHEIESDPNTFVVTRSAGIGTYSTLAKGDETINTPLYPFRPTVDSWYTSPMVRETKTFGYSYPETTGLTIPTSSKDRSALMKAIGKMYEPLAKAIRQSKQQKLKAGAGMLPQAEIIGQIVNKDLPATTAQLQTLISQLPADDKLLEASKSKPALRDLAPNNKYLEWLTNIKAEKHALDGAYAVHLFLGPPDETNVDLWAAAPTHVGTFAPLGQSSSTQCGKCQEDQRDHTQVTSQIPLTLALVERYLAGIIPNLNPETVVPYLTKELHWRVARSDGTSLENRSTVDGLTVFVISNEVTIPDDYDQFPLYAPDVVVYPAITTNLQGRGRGDGTGLIADDLSV